LDPAQLQQKLVTDMKKTSLTVHGFRSTFRNWAAERTHVPGEIAEAALGHVNGDKTEAAYLRSDFFERRRKLMEAWAKFCKSGRAIAGKNVVPFRRTAAELR
jgi:integrase